MSKIIRIIVTIILLIQSSLGQTKLSPKQRNALPLIKILNGFKAEKDPIQIQNQIEVFAKYYRNIFLFKYSDGPDCTNYFQSAENLLLEIENNLINALHIRNNPTKFKYAQARLEILADLFYKMGYLAFNEAEGGITPFLGTKNRCIHDVKDRALWIQKIKRTQAEMQKSLKQIFGTRKFDTNFHLSSFLAQEKLKKAEQEWDNFLLTSVPSALLFPIAIHFLTLQIGRTTIAITSALISGYIGIQVGPTLFKQKSIIKLEIHKQLYDQIKMFLDVDLESPRIYFPFIYQFETELNQFFKGIIKEYQAEYREALMNCVKNNKKKNCHKNWYKFLSISLAKNCQFIIQACKSSISLIKTPTFMP